jgi:hypothetical protein
MKSIKLIVILVAVALPALSIAGEYVVLNRKHAKEILEQCSRDAPTYEGGWTPSKQEVEGIENNLSKLDKLETDACCSRGKISGNATDYNRQYVGIVINGKKVIYINASSAEMPFSRRKPMMGCDGGKRFWGAVYDPETNEFNSLAFNGEA